jgi:hypothetical protein
MYNANSLLAEAQEALDKVWFLQSLEVIDRTNSTLSLRLYIRHDLFVQAFLGELTNSLYFALIEGNRRIFGIDRECKQWHVHPFEAPHKHEPLAEGLGPKPLLTFLSRVEMLLIENDLF